jgi:hypothetical protein
MSKLTIQQFAFNIGSAARKVRDAADPFHAAYLEGTPEQRKDLRQRWMLGHLEGQGVKGSERILSEGKGSGAKPEHVKAIDRASSDFRYMVVRPEPKTSEPVKAKRISPVLRSAAMDFLANFEGESLEEQLKQALTVLRAL